MRACSLQPAALFCACAGAAAWPLLLSRPTAHSPRHLQILKQAELRELRRHEERSAPSFGRRASRPLEAKWRLTIPRSPLCEGCGVRTIAASEGSSGSKAWKCGPCVRAIEEVSSWHQTLSCSCVPIGKLAHAVLVGL